MSTVAGSLLRNLAFSRPTPLRCGADPSCAASAASALLDPPFPLGSMRLKCCVRRVSVLPPSCKCKCSAVRQVLESPSHNQGRCFARFTLTDLMRIFEWCANTGQ